MPSDEQIREWLDAHTDFSVPLHYSLVEYRWAVAEIRLAEARRLLDVMLTPAQYPLTEWHDILNEVRAFLAETGTP